MFTPLFYKVRGTLYVTTPLICIKLGGFTMLPPLNYLIMGGPSNFFPLIRIF